MDEQIYKNFFDDFLNFKNIQKQQKARGLNDFNLLTTVLKYDDEVRLHSRMLGALLSSDGKHYQDSLFLEKFLEVIGLDDFGLNLSNAKVKVEYKNIDLYITDGLKHIIIENKIWAKDQPCQLIKYINIIVEENKKDFNNPVEDDILDENLLRVIYLTPQDKEVPSEHKVMDGYIEYRDTSEKCFDELNLKKYKAKYKKIAYKSEILQWLKESQNEMRNITNLSESIKQYISVVEQVNNNYKGNVMTLEKYMDENEEMYDCLKDLFEVNDKIEPKFWNELLKKLESCLSDTYDIKYKEESNLLKKPEIEILLKKNQSKFIYIRRDTFTFISYSSSECLDAIDKACWKYTTPKINFKVPNDEYWRIAKPSGRKKSIEKIVKQVKELI